MAIMIYYFSNHRTGARNSQNPSRLSISGQRFFQNRFVPIMASVDKAQNQTVLTFERLTILADGIPIAVSPDNFWDLPEPVLRPTLQIQ